MKTPKIKRYRLAVSRTFPATHPKSGQPTNFVDSIKVSLAFGGSGNKLHTIRANYPLWDKRIKAVQEGKAVIELFYWEGKPYKSLQLVFAKLDKDSGCGVQVLEFEEMIMTESPVLITKYKGLLRIFRTKTKIELEDIAKNDGLSLEDFKSWFRKYDLSKPMAIIHFTKFRY